MKSSDFQIFNEFPEPIFAREDGSIVYCNAAAVHAFQGLAVGDPVPPLLAAVRPGSVLTLDLPCGPFSATAVAEGQVLVLRPMGGATIPTAVLSAQLREKVGNLMAAAGLLAHTVEQSGEKNAVLYLATINQNLYRVIRMVGNLELAQRWEEESPFRPAAMDMGDFCRTLSMGVEPLAAAAGVEFTYESDCGCVITTGDVTLLRHMILSLISNAIKAAGGGGKVRFRLEHNGTQNVLLTVKDNGPGLSGAGLAAYFNGGSDAIPTPQGGLGLGLSIVRHVAQLHGGSVMVESREGEGLRAVVSLPAKPPKGTALHLPPIRMEDFGGIGPLLVGLSDALPWQVFLPQDLE